MRVIAELKNSLDKNDVVVSTNDDRKVISIPPKSSGQGSSVNGGELLFLSLATCFCNDIYREAASQPGETKAEDAANENGYLHCEEGEALLATGTLASDEL